MRLIERYLFRQMLGPTVLAVLALSAVAILSQSLGQLEIIVDQRQSALVFAKITLLALPQLFVMIMPVAVFVAALVALNRLHTEHEIVVCFASGMSRWRVISPAMRLAIGAAIITLAVNLWGQPMALRAMRDQLFAVKTDLAAALVREGEFTEPSSGLTVYAKSIDSKGVLHDVFLHQDKADGGDTTYTARDGIITKRNGAPVLILRNGANQEFNRQGVLNYLRFDEYIYDLAPFVKTDELIHYKISDRYLHELIYPDLTQDWEQHNRKKMLAEAHSRLSSPLYNIAFMALALAAVIGGAFSRLGYGRRIARMSAIAAVVRLLGFAAQSVCDHNPSLNALQYLIPIVCIWWALSQVFRQKVSRFIALRPIEGRVVAA